MFLRIPSLLVCSIHSLSDFTGSYKLMVPKDQHYEPSKDLGVKVRVYDPEDSILLDRVSEFPCLM